MTAERQLSPVVESQIGPPALINEAGAIVQMIERAASNPAVDIDKMERLLQMREREYARSAKMAFDAALAEMQPELPEIVERGEIKTDKNKAAQSTYAKWEDINAAIKPILARYGFSLSFRVARTDNQISVTGILTHRQSHAEETTLSLPVDTSGNKNAVQAVGSSTSYGQRYTAKLLLNLTSRGADDDGNAAGDGGYITEDQAADIQALMEDVGADRGRFLAYIKVGSIAEIPSAQFKKVLATLEAKRGAK